MHLEQQRWIFVQPGKTNAKGKGLCKSIHGQTKDDVEGGEPMIRILSAMEMKKI